MDAITSPMIKVAMMKNMASLKGKVLGQDIHPSDIQNMFPGQIIQTVCRGQVLTREYNPCRIRVTYDRETKVILNVSRG